jgi:uncharacterized protein YdiU (UPF0061 family)
MKKINLEELLATEPFASDPGFDRVRKTVAEVIETFNYMRDSYAACGLALAMGLEKDADTLNDRVHDWAMGLHDSTHDFRDALAMIRAARAGAKERTDRAEETLNWIKESEDQ